MSDCREVRFAEVLNELIFQKYGRHRPDLAKRVGLSTSAISQYVSKHTTPSLPVLCKLADALEVSLDHLVYGDDSRKRDGTEVLSPIILSFDKRLEDIAAMAHRRQDLVGRLIRVLERKIQSALDELKEQTLPAGFITDDELMVIESCSVEIDIISMDLSYDIYQDGENYLAGRFSHVVANNLKIGAAYRFLLPSSIDEEVAKRTAEAYRGMLEMMGCSRSVFQRNCIFKRMEQRAVSGAGFCNVDLQKLGQSDPSIVERLNDSIFQGWIGYTIAPSNISHGDCLMDISHIKNGKLHFDELWRSGIRL